MYVLCICMYICKIGGHFTTYKKIPVFPPRCRSPPQNVPPRCRWPPQNVPPRCRLPRCSNCPSPPPPPVEVLVRILYY